MRIILSIVGVVLAAIGGVIAYRALFLEPPAAFVVTNENVRELPNTLRVVGGLLLFFFGAGIAFFAALKKR